MTNALRYLYPNANPLRDFIVVDDGSGPRIAHWNQALLGPVPTDEQIAAAAAAAATSAANKEQLLSAFTMLPRGVQAFFEPTRAAVNAAFDAKDWAGIRDIIATTPTPNEMLETTRLQFAALVDQLLPPAE